MALHSPAARHCVAKFAAFNQYCNVVCDTSRKPLNVGAGLASMRGECATR
ncbi:hypothetical protein SAMN05443245_0620 [Paraburkholderia fungorum]|uniref:Uncharacterized protein n=1 Tax=Paraburkholderia fungorum TaxID=134537 RepID=A0A1H0ZF87_9BURK|nr:hypothetical protein SAMN05443245_0620 [Paraburkholderia fungorum]